MGLLAFLMVSTWRYPSFKEINLLRPRSPWTFVVAGSLIFLIWNFPQPVLLAISVCYMMSGIIIRVGGIIRRKINPHRDPHPPPQEHPVV
jgi:CDP-diacylglycerol--serine O-phosphatidyltransferase